MILSISMIKVSSLSSSFLLKWQLYNAIEYHRISGIQACSTVSRITYSSTSLPLSIKRERSSVLTCACACADPGNIGIPGEYRTISIARPRRNARSSIYLLRVRECPCALSSRRVCIYICVFHDFFIYGHVGRIRYGGSFGLT